MRKKAPRNLGKLLDEWNDSEAPEVQEKKLKLQADMMFELISFRMNPEERRQYHDIYKKKAVEQIRENLKSNLSQWIINEKTATDLAHKMTDRQDLVNAILKEKKDAFKIKQSQCYQGLAKIVQEHLGIENKTETARYVAAFTVDSGLNKTFSKYLIDTIRKQI